MKTPYPENRQKPLPMKKMITLVVLVALALPTLLAQEGEENQADIKPRRNPGEVQTLFDPGFFGDGNHFFEKVFEVFPQRLFRDLAILGIWLERAV